MISEILPVGKSCAITERKIADALGVRDTRTISQQVERERKAGAPICATCGTPPGLYLAANSAEMDDYRKSLQRRHRNLTATLRAISNTADRMAGQLRMEGFD